MWTRALLSFFMPVWAALVLFANAPTALAFEANDPRYCLERMQKAINESDARSFDELADIEGIAKDIFAELEAASKDEKISKLLPPVLTLLASQGALTNPLASGYLAREGREFVLYGVGSGAFAGNKVDGYQSSSMLSPLFGLVSMGRKEIHGMGMPTRVDNDNMSVPFQVRDQDNGNSYPVQGLFAKTVDGWRLVGIQNLRDLIIRLGVESRDNDVV